MQNDLSRRALCIDHDAQLRRLKAIAAKITATMPFDDKMRRVLFGLIEAQQRQFTIAEASIHLPIEVVANAAAFSAELAERAFMIDEQPKAENRLFREARYVATALPVRMQELCWYGPSPCTEYADVAAQHDRLNAVDAKTDRTMAQPYTRDDLPEEHQLYSQITEATDLFTRPNGWVVLAADADRESIVHWEFLYGVIKRCAELLADCVEGIVARETGMLDEAA